MKIKVLLKLIEDQNDPLLIAKNDILDMITPIRSSGEKSIPIEDVIDFLNNDPDIQGVNVDLNFIQNAIEGIDGVDVHTDAQGNYIIDLDSINDVSPQGSPIDKKGQDKVDAAAVRAAKKDM